MRTRTAGMALTMAAALTLSACSGADAEPEPAPGTEEASAPDDTTEDDAAGTPQDTATEAPAETTGAEPEGPYPAAQAVTPPEGHPTSFVADAPTWAYQLAGATTQDVAVTGDLVVVGQRSGEDPVAPFTLTSYDTATGALAGQAEIAVPAELDPAGTLPIELEWQYLGDGRGLLAWLGQTAGGGPSAAIGVTRVLSVHDLATGEAVGEPVAVEIDTQNGNPKGAPNPTREDLVPEVGWLVQDAGYLATPSGVARYTGPSTADDGQEYAALTTDGDAIAGITGDQIGTMLTDSESVALTHASDQLAVLTGTRVASGTYWTEVRLLDPATAGVVGQGSCESPGPAQVVLSPARTHLVVGTARVDVEAQKVDCLDPGLTATEWIADDGAVRVMGAGGYGIVDAGAASTGETVPGVELGGGVLGVTADTYVVLVDGVLAGYPRG